MTQTQPESMGVQAMVAQCSIEPTEMGVRVTIRNRAAIVTCEFDVEEPPEVLLGMLAAAPQIVTRMVAQLEDDDDDEGGEGA